MLGVVSSSSLPRFVNWSKDTLSEDGDEVLTAVSVVTVDMEGADEDRREGAEVLSAVSVVMVETGGGDGDRLVGAAEGCE